MGPYRRFIRDYTKIASSLTNSLKKERFKWLEHTEEASKAFKTAISSALVLVLPDFNLPFELECDASGNRIRVVLMQRGKHIVFASRVLSGRVISLSTYEKELMIIVEVVYKWQPYLLGSRFTIKTGHSNLKYLFGQRITMAV